LDDEVNPHFVVPTFWNNHIRMAFGRFYEFHVHWPHRGKVLIDYGINRSASFPNVAPETSYESKVRLCINEYLYIHQIAKQFIFKDKNSFQNNCRRRIQAQGGGSTRMLREIVNRAVNCLSIFKQTDMLNQKRGVEGIGVIEVLARAALQRKVWKVFIVMILLKYEDTFGRECGNNAVGNRRLSGTCAATYSDNQTFRQDRTSKFLSKNVGVPTEQHALGFKWVS